ncbi:MAG: hypothetical protein IH616_05475 [Gemmatimonadales bacterium]|jgi:hypothetical protein|nr:hypothetical protein [Gemmatimonadales bacterium]
MSRRHLVLLCLPILGGAACVGGTDVPAVTIWETQLDPELTHPDVGGQAAAVSEPSGTSVGILVTGAEPGEVHAWGLRLGTCATPGTQIGPASDYPDLVVGLEGGAERDTHLGSRLSLDQSYHIEVRVSAADAARVACGDLVAR